LPIAVLSIRNSAEPSFASAQTKGRFSGTAFGETNAACGASAVGRATKTIDPQVSPREAHRCPPTFDNRTAYAQAIPMPSDFVVKNASKIRSRLCGSIPVPVSLTDTRTLADSPTSDLITTTHRFDRVRYQIHKNLLQLDSTGWHRWNISTQIGSKKYRFLLNFALNQNKKVVDDVVDVNPRLFRPLLLEHCSYAINDLTGAMAALDDVSQ
jgi:hypothetical protein